MSEDQAMPILPRQLASRLLGNFSKPSPLSLNYLKHPIFLLPGKLRLSRTNSQLPLFPSTYIFVHTTHPASFVQKLIPTSALWILMVSQLFKKCDPPIDTPCLLKLPSLTLYWLFLLYKHTKVPSNLKKN